MVTKIKPATKNDALHVAAVIDIGGHGIALEQWTSAGGIDHSTFSAARDDVLDDNNTSYHYSKAYLLEVDGIIAGGVIGSRIERAQPVENKKNPYLSPLETLESRLEGYWSMIAIAIYPEFRGKGFATPLLDRAVSLAKKTDALGISLVVEDSSGPYGSANATTIDIIFPCRAQVGWQRPTMTPNSIRNRPPASPALLPGHTQIPIHS